MGPAQKWYILLLTFHWQEHKHIATQAAEKAGMSMEQAQELLEKVSTPQVKNQLKETTEAACKYGVSNSVPNPVLRQRILTGFPSS